MLLKKRHRIAPGWTPVYDRYGNLTNEPPIATLEVIHTGVDSAQNFSAKLTDKLLKTGLCSFDGEQFVLHTSPDRLLYTIQAWPGEYRCCHCGAMLLGAEADGSLQRDHLMQYHSGIPSPDPSNPAGYRLVTSYECELNAEQHALYQRPEGSPVSHWRGKK